MMFDNYDIVQKIVTKLKALPELFTALVQKVDTNSQALESALTTSDIANNLTTETSGKVLDASQGYALAQAVGNALTPSDIANNLTTDTSGKVLDASQGYALDVAVKKSGLTIADSRYDDSAQEFNFEAEPSAVYIVIVANYGGKTPSAFLVNAMPSAGGAFKIVNLATGTVTATLTSVDYKTLKIETETYCTVKIFRVHD